jgi:hypothetical protein
MMSSVMALASKTIASVRAALAGRGMPTRATGPVVRWCVAGASAAAIAAGCSVGRATAADAAAARRLVGAWDICFHIADAPPGRLRGGRPVDVRAVLAFAPNHELDALTELDAPTNVGTFDADFTAAGFDGREGGQVPSAAARAWGPDSVVIVLGPGGRHPAVLMRGMWAGDSLLGTWSLVSSRTGWASGSFVMARHPGPD